MHKKEFISMVSLAIQGSKAYATYTITRNTWADAFKLKNDLYLQLKEKDVKWYRDYTIEFKNNNLIISIYTKETDAVLRQTVPELIL